MLWSSLLITVQPLGTSTDSLAFDAVPVDVPPPVGVGIGVGVPAGVGLDRDVKLPPVCVFLPNPLNASTVPHPAMITTSPTTTAAMITHGVRWTGGCTPPPVAGA